MKLHQLICAFFIVILFTGCYNDYVIVNLSKYKPHIDNYKAQTTAGLDSRCPPEFPFKDGWLGGDGDVSVPLDATTTLFLFSDTYVGRKKQKSRAEHGLKMVANTVAIQNCYYSDYSEIQYFWNNMYTRNPEPIFKSTNPNHKFWVVDAFILQSALYVLLEKIAPKPNALSNDIFNFTKKGFTLAKIKNPYLTPDEWEITYTPLPNFQNPTMSLLCHAKYKEYIYFFISQHDKTLVLVRKLMDDFDNAHKLFEYFARNKTWKTGIDVHDLDTIAMGFRCNTVKYHPDIKQWVMINDIEFMDKQIKMRTASELTGPWSDEIIIYEIPEMTPGNALYHKSNFCYLPRECIQNYDAKNKLMLITYDVNNSELSEVRENPMLYSPKVIRVPLKF